jgi:hypothetical protein
MMGDSWAHYAEEARRTKGISGYLYFVAYFYICNFMFLRLFIAIIIFNFELTDEEKIAGQRFLYEQVRGGVGVGVRGGVRVSGRERHTHTETERNRHSHTHTHPHRNSKKMRISEIE